MRKVLVVATAGLGVALITGVALAEGRRVGFLTTQASAGDPTSIALDFIRADGAQRGLTELDLEDVMVLSRTLSSHNQTTHIQLRQRFAGIEVANSSTSINISRDGQVINLTNRFVPDIANRDRKPFPTAASDGRHRCGRASTRAHRPGPPLDPRAGERRDPRVALPLGRPLARTHSRLSLAYYALDSGEVRLAWDLVLRPPDGRHWWNIWVDAASGRCSRRATGWTVTPSLRPPGGEPADGRRTGDEPGRRARLAVRLARHQRRPGAEFTDTRGNNVFAQEDIDANNTGGFRAERRRRP